MRRVRVDVGQTPYDVLIGRGASEPPQLRRCLGKGAGGIVVSSEGVMRLHGSGLMERLGGVGFKALAVVLLGDAEAAKTMREWERAIRVMARAGLDRSSMVIAFGGGSIGDAAGFAAATYMRGIRVIQIPTTLLSMVDSSVGGKTGINLAEGKNLVGSFHQPSLVLADLAFLQTLPAREHQSGVYEILKCGLLRSAALLRLVERTRGLRAASEAEMETAIAEAVRVKARIVERDERERGERVLLNFGHTLGHALEAATSYRVFTHGEAVGYGMEFAVDFGLSLGLTKPLSARRIQSAIEAVGSRTPLRPSMARGAYRATLSDKKRKGQQMNEVLLAGPQRPFVHRSDAAAFATRVSEWISARSRS